ncbi:MAG TPA: adenosine deaminase [Terriglobales bacterium]|nr:adenosine deaminase [Terriglobales bacterium]
MPKGGDLHNHLIGSVYAENFIRFAAADGLCVNRSTSALLAPPCDENNRPPVRRALEEDGLYRQMLKAFSMLDFQPGSKSGHDHFFDTFPKFLLVTREHTGDFLAEVVSRAAAQNESYLELILDLEQGSATELSKRLTWTEDFAAMRAALLDAGLQSAVASRIEALDAAESKMRASFACSTDRADRGCRLVVRYISEVLRAFPPAQVFAQMVFGFEMASRDPRVVALNLVMAEDAYVPRRDFGLHMRMLDYLHRLYPKVHITLHAGELAPGLVPPEDLRSHIRESIRRGHAERIGHGVDVMYEDNPTELLREMAQRRILVEICLTSNDVILGVRGLHHPLPIYLKRGVPVALATDDEGVSRSNLTQEFQRAVESFDLDYGDLKTFARNSLEYSFLPGKSLWAQTSPFKVTQQCASDTPGGQKLSPGCRKLLDSSQRAQLQWALEADFQQFELKF